MSNAEIEAFRKAVTDLTMTVGRLAGGFETMATEFRNERESSAKSRKGIYKALEEMRREQLQAAGDIRHLAERVERMEPAVEDYNRRQVQLETGGVAGPDHVVVGRRHHGCRRHHWKKLGKHRKFSSETSI